MIPLSISLAAPTFGLTLLYLANDKTKRAMIKTAEKGAKFGAKIGMCLASGALLLNLGERVITQNFQGIGVDLALKSAIFFESTLMGLTGGLSFGWWNSI